MAVVGAADRGGELHRARDRRRGRVRASITATVDAQIAQATITCDAHAERQRAADRLGGSRQPLRPGGTFTVVGNNFAPTPAGNVVVVDGVPVTVNAATVNALSITLPDDVSVRAVAPVFIQVTANGSIGGGASTLQVANPRTLAVGQSVVDHRSHAGALQRDSISPAGGTW